MYSAHSALELNIFNPFELKSHLRWHMAEYHVTSTGHLWSNEMRLTIFFLLLLLFRGPCALAHTVHPWLDRFTFVDSLNKSILNCLYLWRHFQIFGPYSTHRKILYALCILLSFLFERAHFIIKIQWKQYFYISIQI